MSKDPDFPNGALPQASDTTLVVPTGELIKCLSRIDVSNEAMVAEKILLFWADSRLVMRQGSMELKTSCVGHFDGAYVISRTSCRKWQRSFRIEGKAAKFLVERRRPSDSDVSELRFTSNELLAGALRLPAKWIDTVPSLPFPDAKLEIHCVPEALPKHHRSPGHDQAANELKKINRDLTKMKLCVDFRVVVDTEELIGTLKQCTASGRVAALQLRTWNGLLIITTDYQELRIPGEGFIRGYAMFDVADVPRLAALTADGNRFTTLNCEKGRLRFLGQTFHLLSRGVPLNSPYQNETQIDSSMINTPPVLQSDMFVPERSLEHSNDSVSADTGEVKPPQDFSLPSILRFACLSTDVQIREAGLEEIVAAAHSTRDKLIRQAAELLRPLKISEHQLQRLLSETLHDAAQQ